MGGYDNYMEQREQFIGNCCPQNEAQNETHCAKVLKMFSADELAKLIMKQTLNTEQKI